jgi:hypothetical protein
MPVPGDNRISEKYALLIYKEEPHAFTPQGHSTKGQTPLYANQCSGKWNFALFV